MSRNGTAHLHQDLQPVADAVIGFLNNYQKSPPLQQFAKLQLRAFVYANLLVNFFNNLTLEVVKELQLPIGQIGRLKRQHKSVSKSARASLSFRGQLFEESDYRAFIAELNESDPDFLKLVDRVEQEFDMNKLEQSLQKWDTEVDAAGKDATDMTEVLGTSILAAMVQKEHKFPSTAEIDRFVRTTFTPDFVKDVAQPVLLSLEQNADEMLADERLVRAEFESRLVDTWKEPLNQLACLIKIAIESGERKASMLLGSSEISTSHKALALVQIHARAIQISNEIFVLLKAGYADGANSRWRSLYELTVVSLFLHKQPEELSERFLAHDVMKSYKEAKEYQLAYRKLGYPPYGRKELAILKKDHDDLITRYGTGFEYRSGYEWIPAATVLGPKISVNFKSLEKYVGLQHWRPFYSLSSNSIHAGSRGFYRLGLIDQNELLLVGASNYGLADPLQNTAISLNQATTALLTFEPDLDDLVSAEVLREYSERIGESAVQIQNEIEIDDLRFKNDEEPQN